MASCACQWASKTPTTSSRTSIARLIASSTPRALVFNCHITGLAVARSLAAHGVEVSALDPDPRGLGQASKAVIERHRCPNPLEDEKGFVAYLLDNARHFGEGAVLFPTNDEWVLAVARYRSQLETCYRVPFSELSVIDAVLDKRRLYADAHHLGIPIPRTYSLQDPRATAKEIRYPAIVKPAEQRRFYDRFGVKVFRAENAKELMRFAGEAADLACVAQEIVDVPAGGFYSLCSYVAPDGEMRGAFVGRKLEQYPEGFGTGCLVIGEQVPEILDRGTAILRAYGYHGISEVEFIWDPERREHLLLDVNPRVWKWIGLPIASGVDLPWLAYSEAIGRGDRAGALRDGMRWIYERDYALLAASRPLFPASGDVVNAVWDPDDPGPFAQLIKNEGPAGKYYCAC
ncbi:MAG: carboxylate--amine ligase [Chloroflexi bacterium]|nr:MAG: carboxylate--amine ligase [Chloroflexota bacterium]